MNAPAPDFLQQNLDLHLEIIVDLFAGGGGMSEAIRMASGRNPDIAINHNPDALSMHEANHPDTRHYVADVFEVCPYDVTKGRPVGHLHASPDCTHHSQAAGGQPRNEKRRALSWVVIRWAGQVRPRVITLENVKQVMQWGPLIAKRDPATGRVITLDQIPDPDRLGKSINRIAEQGEVVPRARQYLIPDPKRKGKTWARFIGLLRGMGYAVNVQNMIAADYGAGTTRDRLFMHARCDGLPPTFPEATHHKKPQRGQKAWSAAHEHIDFSLPARSIFDRKKPLAPATMRRVAKGIEKFVLKNPSPFIVQVTQSSANGVRSVASPLPTITTAKGGEFTLATPVMVQAAHGDGQPGKAQRWGSGAKSVTDPIGSITASNGQALATANLVQIGYGEREGQDPRALDIEKPLGTVVAGGIKHALVASHLARMKFDNVGADLNDPLPTITSGGNSSRPAGAAHSLGLVSANLVTMRNNMDGADIEEPVSTITCSGSHHAIVECHLSQEDEERALRVAAFLISYYGTDNLSGLDQPLPTVTTKDRLALVTAHYQGEAYVIVDITLRMLEPHELYSATGFHKNYITTHGHDGRLFNKSKQVLMVGNAVSPKPGAALFHHCHKGDDLLIRRVA